MGRVATITEVARLAGVSVTTASKAINGKNKVSDATRERVLAAARELNFHPSPIARSLHSGRSGTVGLVLVDSATLRFAIPVILGVEAELAEIDLSLILSDARGDFARVPEIALTLRRRKVDGLIIVGDNNFPTPSVTDVVDGPVIYAHGETDRPDDLANVTDDQAGIALAVDHLAALGRRDIAHLSGPRGTRAASERATGFARAMAEHGLAPRGNPVFGPWSQPWSRGAVADLLSEHPELDAIVCDSDQLAAGAIAAIKDTGRKVPDDIAITGYDNLQFFAEEFDPPLTSVDPNLEDLGAAAARRLFQVVDGEKVEPGLLLQHGSLVVRGSTSSPVASPA